MKAIVVGGGIAALFTAYFLRNAGIETVVIGESPNYPHASLVLTTSMPNVGDILLSKESLSIYRAFIDPKPIVSIDILPRSVDLSPLRLGNVPYKVLYELKGVRLSDEEFIVKTTDYLIPIRRVLSKLARQLNIIRAKVSLKRSGGRLIVYADGTEYRGDFIVLAAGPGNIELANNIELRLPLMNYQCYAAVMLAPPSLSRLSVGDDVLGWYSRPILGNLVAAGDGCGRPGEPPRLSYGIRLARLVSYRFGWAIPLFTKSGTCSVSPSGGPVYGEVEEGLYVIGGLDGYGSMVGPALAKRLAELIVKGIGEIDDYRIEKYMGSYSWDPCSIEERHSWGLMIKGRGGLLTGVEGFG